MKYVLTIIMNGEGFVTDYCSWFVVAWGIKDNHNSPVGLMFSCPGSSEYKAGPEDGDSMFLRNAAYLPTSPHSVTTQNINIDVLKT
jgi:hypothetical protein